MRSWKHKFTQLSGRVWKIVSRSSNVVKRIFLPRCSNITSIYLESHHYLLENLTGIYLKLWSSWLVNKNYVWRNVYARSQSHRTVEKIGLLHIIRQWPLWGHSVIQQIWVEGLLHAWTSVHQSRQTGSLPLWNLYSNRVDIQHTSKQMNK